MTHRRPFVSAKNPHICEEVTIPKKHAAPKIPFSCVVNLKSHCDTGNIKLIPHVSIRAAFKIDPDIKIKK